VPSITFAWKSNQNILSKEPKSKDIESDHVFAVNDQFSSSYSVSILVPVSLFLSFLHYESLEDGQRPFVMVAADDVSKCQLKWYGEYSFSKHIGKARSIWFTHGLPCKSNWRMLVYRYLTFVIANFALH